MTREDPLREIHRELIRCIEKESEPGLDGIRKTIGGNIEIFGIHGGAWALTCFAEQGIDALTKIARRERTHLWIGTVVEVLGYAATEPRERPSSGSCPKPIWEMVQSSWFKKPDLAGYAREQLRELCLQESEKGAIDLLEHGLAMEAGKSTAVRREIIRILTTRWFTVGIATITEHERLVVEKGNDEATWQKWFTRHPQLLDPMAVEIWTTPDLHGRKKPDFIVQRFDNSYIVVEIKTPATKLVTQGNRLSAATNSAVEQVYEYGRHIREQTELKWKMPGIEHIACVVVAGMQSELSEEQLESLRDANMRNGNVQIVGFDWLAKRARSIQENLLLERIGVRRLRTG